MKSDILNMEATSFSDMFESYFSELGRWKVWKTIFLGQVLSILLSGKCIMTTLLQSATWQFPTTGQLVGPYIALFLFYTPLSICNGMENMSEKWWIWVIACTLDVEAGWLLVMSQSGVGAALVGAAWRRQRLGVAHVAGATLGLMAVVCVVWADVEGAPTDGQNQLVGDMLCLAGTLLFALVTVLQEMILKIQTCPNYLAMLGAVGTIVSCTQTFFLDFGELMAFNSYERDTLFQLTIYCSVQTIFQILQCLMLTNAGSIILHLSLLSADYYTLIAGMFMFQFKFHAIYFMSYLLAMVGVFLFSGRPIIPPTTPAHRLPQLVNISVQSQDNVSLEFTVPMLDCIPIDGLEPPMSRDTTFTSFLGGPQSNGNVMIPQPDETQKENT